jgi:hypothetical protein
VDTASVVLLASSNGYACASPVRVATDCIFLALRDKAAADVMLDNLLDVSK